MLRTLKLFFAPDPDGFAAAFRQMLRFFFRLGESDVESKVVEIHQAQCGTGRGRSRRRHSVAYINLVEFFRINRGEKAYSPGLGLFQNFLHLSHHRKVLLLLSHLIFGK